MNLQEEMTHLEDLILSLHDIEAIRFGKFKLHSGRSSSIYFDLRVLVTYPSVLKQVANAYANRLQLLEFDILAAYPYAGLPIGVAISLEMEVPLIYPRKQVKNYGTAKQIEGVWEVGQRVVLIEDLITSGKSILEAGAIMKSAGLQISESVVLIDREQGGKEDLAAQGHTVHSIFALTQLLKVLEKHERISAQRRAGILSRLK